MNVAKSSPNNIFIFEENDRHFSLEFSGTLNPIAHKIRLKFGGKFPTNFQENFYPIKINSATSEGSYGVFPQDGKMALAAYHVDGRGWGRTGCITRAARRDASEPNGAGPNVERDQPGRASIPRAQQGRRGHWYRRLRSVIGNCLPDQSDSLFHRSSLKVGHGARAPIAGC